MIGLHTVFLISVGIVFIEASSPNCSMCKYHNGIGFVEGDLCQSYFMCVKNPNFVELSELPDVSHDDLYRYEGFCCAEGLAWDQEHLTCKVDETCDDPRDRCPNVTTTTNTPCLQREDPNDPSKFITSNNFTMDCPYGQVWNQTYCTCVLGEDVELESPCSKILNFSFDGTYDSSSCYNFAKGDAYGKPSIEGNVLCLNGEEQYLSIGYLYNWFAWNPVANTFTVCLWILPAKDGQTAGILNMNCDMVDPQTGESGSVVDLVLEGGVLILYLGQNRIDSKMIVPANEWTKICVVFDNGMFKVYWNGYNHFGDDFEISTSPYTFAPNSHTATTLGVKPGYDSFQGYLDDFCFYTEAESAESIKECYEAGPSNTYALVTGPTR